MEHTVDRILVGSCWQKKSQEFAILEYSAGSPESSPRHSAQLKMSEAMLETIEQIRSK